MGGGSNRYQYDALYRLTRATGREHAGQQVDASERCSATPALDFGNLLRPPLETNDVTVRGVYEGYKCAGGWLPNEWRGIAKLADTLARVSFAGHVELAEMVLTDARAPIVDAVKTLAREPPLSGGGIHASILSKSNHDCHTFYPAVE